MTGRFWVAVMWAGFVLGSAGTGWGVTGAILASPLALGPLVSAIYTGKRRQKELNAYVARFLTALGHTDSRLYLLTKQTAIGLNPTTQNLVLGDGSLVRTYKFDDIREWAVEEKTGRRGASNLANMQEANLAAERSGLVVRVRDAEKPSWLVTMDEATLERWFELMTQTIKEGGPRLVA